MLCNVTFTLIFMINEIAVRMGGVLGGEWVGLIYHMSGCQSVDDS